MKKNNKKGFTIVELVIVIAVIAILAAVLIPTFSGVVSKANANAAVQEARTLLTNVLSGNTQGSLNDAKFFVVNGTTTYQVNYSNSKLDVDKVKASNVTADDLSADKGALSNVTGSATYADYAIVVKDYTLFTINEQKAITEALGLTGSITWTTSAVADQDYREVTLNGTKFKVYFNTDMSGNCVAFIK